MVGGGDPRGLAIHLVSPAHFSQALGPGELVDLGLDGARAASEGGLHLV